MARLPAIACAAAFALVSLPSSAATLQLWQGIPNSQEQGTTYAWPLVLQAVDDTGAPLPNVAVTFATDASCGSLEGATSATVLTDSEGLADAPLFTAASSERYCDLTADASGAATFTHSTYEFSADHVVIGMPATYSVQPNGIIDIVATFSADGVPVFLPPVTVQVSAAPNGATAVGPTNPLFLYYATELRLDRLRGNTKQGRYTITVTRGPVSATTLIDQHK